MPAPERSYTPEEETAARHLMDTVNVHVIALLTEGGSRERPAFVAVRLADGKPADGHNPLYDSRKEAARFHPHDTNVFFVKVGRETMPFNEAMIVLQTNRMARARGVIFREEEVIVPQLPELLNPFIPRTLRGLKDRIFPNGY